MNALRPVRVAAAALLLCVSASLGRAGEPALPAEGGPRLTLAASSTFAGRTTVRSAGVDRGDVATSESSLSLTQQLTPALTLGLGLETISVDLPDRNTATAVPDDLRSVTASITYTHEFNPRWSGLVLLSPGWHSATGGRALGRDAFGVTTAVIARHQRSATFSAAYGVAYDSLARSSLRVLPVLGCEWKPAADWTVALGFPRTAITYDLARSWRLSLVGEGSGGTYFVARDPLPAGTGKPSLRHSRLEYYEVRTGLSLAYACSPTASIAVTGGLVLDRTFDYHAAHYKLSSRGNTGYVSLSSNVAF